MKYIIEDYNISKHQEVDTWVNEKKYENAKIINEFALFNEPISDFYNHICTYPHDLANVKSFIKVFKNTNNILGVVVFHYYVDEVYYLRINPLIVNPSLMNQGIGKNILKEITKNLNEIINDKVDFHYLLFTRAYQDAPSGQEPTYIIYFNDGYSFREFSLAHDAKEGSFNLLQLESWLQGESIIKLVVKGHSGIGSSESVYIKLQIVNNKFYIIEVIR